MNRDIFKGKWKEIKGEAKKRWGNLTDDDFMQVEGEEDKFIGMLQKRYGYGRDQAEKEYNDFMRRYHS